MTLDSSSILFSHSTHHWNSNSTNEEIGSALKHSTQNADSENLPDWDLKTVGFIHKVLNQGADPTLVIPMLLAGPAFNIGKVAALRGLLAQQGATWMSRGLFLKGLPLLAGFFLETSLFSLGSRAMTHHLKGPVPWDPGSLAMDWALAGMTLGFLKTAGFAGRKGTQWARGLDEFKPQLWTQADHHALFWTSQASAYLGLVGSHSIQSGMFPEMHPEGGNVWIDSLGTHIALGLGGGAGRRALGAQFRAMEQSLAAEAHRLYLATKPQFNIFGIPFGMTPAAATSAGAAMVHSTPEISRKGPSQENIFKAVGIGEGDGRVDPKESVGLLPTGSLTPHGDDVSTHQRAVGDPRWVARAGEYTKHLKYVGDGKYEVVKANEANSATVGQIITEAEAFQHFEKEVKAGTGFQPLTTDLPIETTWAGQLPTGLRGSEGETEKTLLEYMGLRPSQIKKLSFNRSITLITKADQFSLQGIFSLYRSGVQWGGRLNEIVGADPRKMAIAVASGIGGLNNLIIMILASAGRKYALSKEDKELLVRVQGALQNALTGTSGRPITEGDIRRILELARIHLGEPTDSTDPATGPSLLPKALGDSMSGDYVGILGPKDVDLPEILTRLTVIPTVGPNPVDQGACATALKNLVQAGNLLGPKWPGQNRPTLAFFAGSEAPLGHIFARAAVTGFNGVKAMETLKHLQSRNGNFETGYAPLTEDVGGFWMSEGAGTGALMTIDHMFRLGLPIRAGLLGYAVSGDQGGKQHAAELGLGGVSTLMESLEMMIRWQKADPSLLKYLSLHGTGTKENNREEPANLLRALQAFGFEGSIKLGAFKALLGHGLGASGAMELAILERAISQQLAPGVFNLEGRQLDESVKALGERVIVNGEVMRGGITAAGIQSQGFAGNNAAALFRHVNDQVLHEVYGYSTSEIEAYRSRLSGREGQAHAWEEAIRKGDKTIGEFLSWFGLGEPEPAKPEVVDMAANRRASNMAEAFERLVENKLIDGGLWDSSRPAALEELTRPSSRPPAPVTDLSEGPRPTVRVIEGAPAIRKGIKVDPAQMMVSIGRGSMLTTRGGTLATRSAAMNGIDHPTTLMYLAEEAGMVRFTGRDRGKEQWVSTSGERITPQQLAENANTVQFLLGNSGPREIPLEELARELPVRHGGLLPEWIRGRDKVRERLGAVSEKSLKGTPLENQWRNLEWASDMGMYGLSVALDAQAGIGIPLGRLMASNRFGAAQGSAFPGADRLMEIYDRAKGKKLLNVNGEQEKDPAHREILNRLFENMVTEYEKLTGQKLKDKKAIESVTYALQSALMEDPRGIYLNLIMPHLDYVKEVVVPETKGDKALAENNLQRILPELLAEGQLPNTGGVNLTCSQACASGLYALFLARLASMRTGLQGEVPMDAFMVFGADGTFSPFHTAPAVAGFSVRAPMTVKSMVEKLRLQGLLPGELAEAIDKQGLSLAGAWEKLPEELRRRAMSEASAPFSKYAKGLVVAEGAAALPWFNFQKAIEAGLWPSSRLLGIHVNAGEGGNPNLASLDQGIVTSAMVALQQAKFHGVIPQLVQAHGTSTELNNYAEIKSLYYALRKTGVNHLMAVSAIKGLVGHTMGAAGAVDMVMGVQSLLDGEAPGLFNFKTKDLDPRFAERIPEVLNQFKFSPEPIKGNFDGILITSEGFLSADAAAVLGRFPQDIDQAADMLRDYNFPPHVIADWKARAADNRDRGQQVRDSLRKGEITHLDIAAQFGFNPIRTRSLSPPPSPLPDEEVGPLTHRHGKTAEGTPRAIAESMIRYHAETSRKPGDKSLGVATKATEEMKESVNDEAFLQRTFTLGEIEYCRQQPEPLVAFTSLLAAKEAVIEAITQASSVHQDPWQGKRPFLVQMEITRAFSESPQVVLTGALEKVAKDLGISSFNLTINHDKGLASGVVNAG